MDMNLVSDKELDLICGGFVDADYMDSIGNISLAVGGALVGEFPPAGIVAGGIAIGAYGMGLAMRVFN